MSIQHIIGAVFMSAGLIFLIIAAYGVMWFPDFFTRLHAAGVGDTLGVLLMSIGMMVITGFHLLSIKIFVIFTVLALMSPLGTNLIMMAGIHAWDYQEYNKMRHLGKKTDGVGQANSDKAVAAAAPEEELGSDEEEEV